jgi:hypothetical protein
MSTTTPLPYAPTDLDAQLLFACGVSYFIGDASVTEINSTTAAPYFDGTGFTPGTTQTIIQGIIPETAGCLVGQITVSGVNTILIAFRGTMFTEINDWATDLMAEPIDTSTITPTPPYVFPGSVHSGFYLSLAEILPQIQTEVNTLLSSLGSDTPIAITGHSKGGGMASLAAYYLVNGSGLGISTSQVTTTTFASPNPGDTNFAAAMVPFNQKNFINYLDLVPWFPLTQLYSYFISSYFQESPISNPSMQAILLLVLKTMATWNYASAATQTPYINAPNSSGDYIIDPTVSEFTALEYIETAFATASGNQSPNFEAILAAHSHGCGGGYMFAICPSGTCPGPSCALGTPTVNALLNQTVVNGTQTVEVDFVGNLPGSVFNWTNDTPSIGLAASGSGNISSFAAINTSIDTITATITVTPVFSIGASSQGGTPVSFKIAVSPSS